jgi:hypothetical protein
MLSDLLSRMHIVPALIPVADAFAGGVTLEAVSLRDYNRATLIIHTGAREDTGISNIVTVEACSDASGTVATAMAFRSRAQLYSTTVDTWSALTARAATGYNFAAAHTAANVVWFLEVTADEVAAAQAGAMFVRALVAETANKTITASGLWILSEPRYPGALPQTAIV